MESYDSVYFQLPPFTYTVYFAGSFMLWYESVLHSFLLVNSVTLYSFITFCLFFYQIDGYFDCFYFLVSMNNATLNICV